MRRALIVLLLIGCGEDRNPAREKKLEQLHVEWMAIQYRLGQPCPSSLDDFAARYRPEKHVKNTGTNDQWGHPLRWSCERGFRITSAGPDGQFDTADDIVSP